MGNRYTICLLIFVIGFNFSFNPAITAQTVEKPEAKKPDDELQTLTPKLKSLIFPGWGQMSEGKWVKGVLFAASEIGTIIYIIDNNSKGRSYYEQYKNAETIADAVYFRELTERYDKRRNIGLLVAAGIWALNLLDMSLSSSSSEDEKVNKRIYFYLDGAGGVHSGVWISF